MAQDHKKAKRLKPLLDDVPPGFLVEAAWLVARKIDRKSIHDYARRGWLEPVVRGLYRRPFLSGTSPDTAANWTITVLSMQRLMKYDIHVGAKTALSLHGYAHYLHLGEHEVVYLYGNRLPSWLRRLPSPHIFKTRTGRLFRNHKTHPGLEEANHLTGAGSAYSDWSLILSSPERAILELIDELPNQDTFDNVDAIFQGLASLRPKHLDALLSCCRSIKVKRLFFVFADRHQHAWRKHLDVQSYELGSGPRALVRGGRMHPDYQIAVPENYVPTPAPGAVDGP